MRVASAWTRLGVVAAAAGGASLVALRAQQHEARTQDETRVDEDPQAETIWSTLRAAGVASPISASSSPANHGSTFLRRVVAAGSRWEVARADDGGEQAARRAPSFLGARGSEQAPVAEKRQRGDGWFGGTLVKSVQSAGGWVAETDKAGGKGPALLPPQLPAPYRRPYTLVVDLKVLLYTHWDDKKGWRTKKRAGVDFFLSHLSNFYEIVVFTEEPAANAGPIIDRLDPTGLVSHRLYKENMKRHAGALAKDINNSGRDPAKTLMIDTSPIVAAIQPEQCLLINDWKGDEETGLLDLIPFLDHLATTQVKDVRDIVASYAGRDVIAEWHKKRVARQESAPTQAKGSLWDKFK